MNEIKPLLLATLSTITFATGGAAGTESAMESPWLDSIEQKIEQIRDERDALNQGRSWGSFLNEVRALEPNLDDTEVERLAHTLVNCLDEIRTRTLCLDALAILGPRARSQVQSLQDRLPNLVRRDIERRALFTGGDLEQALILLSTSTGPSWGNSYCQALRAMSQENVTYRAPDYLVCPDGWPGYIDYRRFSGL